MFALLLLTVALLAGVLFLQATGSIDLGSLPPLPTAAAVVAILVLLYFSALRSETVDRRIGRLPLIAGLLVLALVGAGIWREYAPGFVTSFFAASRTVTAPPSGLRKTASVRIRKGEAGKFVVHGTINGQPVDMILDSGAATVVLKQSDAITAGIDINGMSFDTALKTANGTNYLAPVRLKSVHVGPVEIDDVEALVAKPGTINESLLGMSFLKRLASYEIAGDFVTLRQ